MLSETVVNPHDAFKPRSQTGERISADEFVAQRDKLHDEQRLAADLAALPAADRARLQDVQAELAKLQAVHVDAMEAVVAARAAIVAAKVSGDRESEATAVHAFDEADRAEARAQWDLAMQEEVAATLQDALIASLRTGQAASAQGRIDDAREHWRAAVAAIAPVFDSIAALADARAVERAAAHDLAYAKGEYATGWDDHGYRERKGPKGYAYAVLPDPSIRVMVGDEVITAAAELVARLTSK